MEEFASETDTSEEKNSAHRAFHKKQWRLRENFWLERLQPHLSKDVLFVYGPQHSTPFSKLLDSKGINNRVIPESYSSSK
jgi:hypothetical protein